MNKDIFLQKLQEEVVEYNKILATDNGIGLSKDLLIYIKIYIQ